MNNLPALRTHSAVLTASPIGSDIPKVSLTRVAALVPKDPLSAYQELNSLLAEQLGKPPPRWRETNWVQELMIVFHDTARMAEEQEMTLLDALHVVAKRRGKSAQVYKMRLCWYKNACSLHEQFKTWMDDGIFSASCATALFPLGTMRPLSEEAVTIVLAELKACLSIVGRILPRHVKHASSEAEQRLGSRLRVNNVRYDLDPLDRRFTRNKTPYS